MSSAAAMIFAATVGVGAGFARADISGFSGFAPVNTTGAAVGDANIGYTGGTSFEVTDGQNGEAASGWNPVAQNIGSFTVSYNYQTIPQYTYAGNGGNSLQADGSTIAFQSPTTGSTAALGGGGGQLGYAGGNVTANSAAIGFELFDNFYSYHGGSELSTGAVQGNVDNVGNIDLSNGDLYNVRISYSGNALTQTVADVTTGGATTQTYTGLNLQSLLGGSTALVGVTGGTGGYNVTQTISNFAFKSTVATYTPIALTGFNQAMVVPASAPQGQAGVDGAITATMDSGLNKSGYTFYEQGYDMAAPTTGLPASGSTFVSQNDAGHVFQMQSYSGSSALLLTAASTTGTLTLSTPTAFSGLSILMADGNGSEPFSVTVHFANGGSELIDGAVSPDWFYNGTVAYDANGRVSSDDGTFDNVANGEPNLYQVDLGLTDQSDLVSSLTFNYEGSTTSTSTLAIYAVSGTPGAAVPEPASLAGLGLAGLTLVRRRRAR